ncbi:MAG: DUF4382 domain-containing protein [Halobacteriales archaeon]
MTERNVMDDDERTYASMNRRQALAVGGGLAATLLAGCTGGQTDEPAGTFRLYVSDQPVAIEEFDSLDVTIDGARLYRGDGTAEDTATATSGATTDGEEMTETTETETEPDDGEGNDGDGYVEVDVDDETVDLTTVTGEKAVEVFDGEVPAGSYSSIHLSVSRVDGVVDGESVDVMLPSERLKVVKPFEVGEDEPLEFVFDITVVRKGQSGGYNLLPVVGESGVVGEHVQMQEVEGNRDGGGAGTATTAE